MRPRGAGRMAEWYHDADCTIVQEPADDGLEFGVIKFVSWEGARAITSCAATLRHGRCARGC